MATVTPWLMSAGLHAGVLVLAFVDLRYAPDRRAPPPEARTVTAVVLETTPQRPRARPGRSGLTAPPPDVVATLARRWMRAGIRIVVKDVTAQVSRPVLERWHAELGDSDLLESKPGLLVPLPTPGARGDSYWLSIEFKMAVVEQAARFWLARQKKGEPREIELRLDERVAGGIVIENLA